MLHSSVETARVLESVCLSVCVRGRETTVRETNGGSLGPVVNQCRQIAEANALTIPVEEFPYNWSGPIANHPSRSLHHLHLGGEC